MCIRDRTYTIYSTLNNNFVLDIKNDSKADNGNVQLNQDNSSNSKEFIVTHDSTGYVLSLIHILEAYELNTGKVIIETIEKMNYDPMAIPGIVVKNHGPFAWGSSPARCV